jgi:hypothetical protein
MTIARYQSKWEGSECRIAIRSAGFLMAHLTGELKITGFPTIVQAAIFTFPRGPPVAAPVQSTNRSLSCVVLCHPSQRKKVGPSTQVSANPSY